MTNDAPQACPIALSYITRRFFLAAVPAVGAAAIVPAMAAASDEERYARLTIEDAHAHLLVRPGDVVVYDTHDCELEDRAVYVALTDTRKRLYVCRARQIEGVWWAERFQDREWYGPMDGEFFRQRIQGRAVAAMTKL